VAKVKKEQFKKERRVLKKTQQDWIVVNVAFLIKNKKTVDDFIKKMNNLVHHLFDEHNRCRDWCKKLVDETYKSTCGWIVRTNVKEATN
jgi:hypothetical protein